MAGWLEGRVLENRYWTDTLFSLRVAAPPLAYEAGQFIKIGLDFDGERVARPFSFVSAPQEPALEFYGVLVPEGRLSPALALLKAGDPVYLADAAHGFLVLSEVPDAETLWLLATGTGIAPYVSMLRAGELWRRYANVVLVHAVRHARELAYREEIEEFMTAHPGRLRLLAFVTRDEPAEAQRIAGPRVPVLAGRVPAAIRDGRLEAAAGRKLSPEGSQVLLCGNPDMVTDASAALAERGMRRHRRREPGHVTRENFW